MSYEYGRLIQIDLGSFYFIFFNLIYFFNFILKYLVDYELIKKYYLMSIIF